MFYLHARRTLANVSSDYKHLTPNHTISFENVLIMIHSLNRFRCTQPLRSKYDIIILIYIATTLPPQLLPVCQSLTPKSLSHCYIPRWSMQSLYCYSYLPSSFLLLFSVRLLVPLHNSCLCYA